MNKKIISYQGLKLYFNIAPEDQTTTGFFWAIFDDNHKLESIDCDTEWSEAENKYWMNALKEELKHIQIEKLLR
jgi:hypothetical protein